MLEILLVDDNAITLAIEKLMLESCGLSVETAESGAEAVRLAEQKPYYIIFMDIHMPDMNGFQASELIRETNTATPVIALSADVIPPDDPAFVQSRMNGSLVKPLQKPDLMELLQRFQAAAPVHGMDEHTSDALFDDDALFAVMKDPAAVQRILSQFLSVHSRDCVQLETLVSKREFLRAREIMHNIIGISGNLFCHRLHRLARILGDELKQECSDHLEEFVGVWNTTYQTLSDCSSRLSSETDETATDADWPSLWENFMFLCSEFDITAIDVFSEHIQVFMANMEPERFDRLRQAVFNYDFLWIIDNLEERHV